MATEEAPPHAWRVVVHFDLDCFYAQVEHNRLKIPHDEPLGVVQWNSLIANNYASRKYGVKRGMSATDAVKLCHPVKLHCVSVELIGDQGSCDSDEHPITSTSGDCTVNAVPNQDNHAQTTLENSQKKIDTTRVKVSLERYRRASVKIFAVLKRFAKKLDAVFERASVDEAYLDITNYCTSLMDNVISTKVDRTNIIGTLQSDDERDRLLAGSTPVVQQIRKAIFDELNYTISAGISHNRLLSKIASSRYKPNQQTIIPARSAIPIMAEQSITAVPGLGGKLGASVSAAVSKYHELNPQRETQPQIPSWEKAKTAADGAKQTVALLQVISLQWLQDHFGPSRGQWLFDIARGRSC